MSSEEKKFKTSGESTVDYPDVYTQIPTPVQEKKQGQLTQQQIKQFFEQVRQVFFINIISELDNRRTPILPGQQHPNFM